MKIVHICTSLEGGAGLCTRRIILSTKKLGVDACAIVAYGEKSELTDVIKPIYPWSKNWLIRKFQVLRNMRRTWPYAETIFKRIDEAVHH